MKGLDNVPPGRRAHQGLVIDILDVAYSRWPFVLKDHPVALFWTCTDRQLSVVWTIEFHPHEQSILTRYRPVLS